MTIHRPRLLARETTFAPALTNAGAGYAANMRAARCSPSPVLWVMLGVALMSTLFMHALPSGAALSPSASHEQLMLATEGEQFGPSLPASLSLMPQGAVESTQPSHMGAVNGDTAEIPLGGESPPSAPEHARHSWLTPCIATMPVPVAVPVQAAGEVAPVAPPIRGVEVRMSSTEHPGPSRPPDLHRLCISRT